MVATKLGDFLVTRVDDLRLWTTLLGFEAGEIASIAGTTPSSDMRRVQAFATKKRPDFAALLTSGNLRQDLLFVRCGETSALRFRLHLGHGDRG